jgi:hypothetical protein
MKNLKKLRLGKSPFMLGAISGGAAIVLDFVWSLSEVLKHFNIIDIVLITHGLLLVGFPICLAVIIYACHKYYKNGYVIKETHDEIEHKKKRLRSDKLCKIGRK